MKLGILISGRGSNMEALVRACEIPGYPARVAVVISNKASAAGLQIAADLGIPTAVVDDADYASREEFAAELVSELHEHEVEAVCLAGFMRLLPRNFLAEFPSRVVNIHPSLLPAFPGTNAHDQAIEYGVRYSGCTVHFVTEVMDAGPIILQAVVPVLEEDTAADLAARILEQEHRIYPKAVGLLAAGWLRVEGRRVAILPGDERRPAWMDAFADDDAPGAGREGQA